MKCPYCGNEMQIVESNDYDEVWECNCGYKVRLSPYGDIELEQPNKR